LADGRPSCPKHPGSKVLLDGRYGKPSHPKQRYKCVQPDGTRHVFTETLPRLYYPGSVECDECEREVPHTHGPTHPRHFHFQARQIAHALMEVGMGRPYRQVARAIRMQANRGVQIWGGQPSVVKWGNLIHDWVEVFAPVIFEEFGPKEWPPIVLLDELSFKRSAYRKNGKLIPGGKPLFSILGAVGYTQARRPFVVRLEAVPTHSSGAWMQFLAKLDGKPDRVVCDQAHTITSAIRLRWINPDTPHIHYCHFHLQENLKKLIPKNRQFDGDPLWDTFQKAFWSPGEFDDFIVEARKVPRMHRWIIRNNFKVREQIAKKVHPYAVGPLEEVLREIGTHFKDRVYGFANRERLNRTLMLMQLEMNHQRNEVRYARIIREHLEASGGFAPKRHLILDPKGKSSLRA
jgi:hypothetical protein